MIKRNRAIMKYVTKTGRKYMNIQTINPIFKFLHNIFIDARTKSRQQLVSYKTFPNNAHIIIIFFVL